MKRTLIFIGSIAIIGALFAGTLAQAFSTSTLDGLLPPGTVLPPETIQKILEERARVEEESRKIKEKFDKERADALKRNLDAIKKIRKQEDEKIDLILNRNDLKPGDQVRISVETYSFKLGESTITWYHNSKKVSSGSGNTSYTFTLGELGTSENIRAVITTSAGKTYELLKTVRPARIYLTWGADSYAPAWYRGKALPPPGSPIKIIAVPDFRIGATTLLPQDIIYEWSVNDAPRTIESGINGKGKNTFSFTAGISSNIDYKITVRGKDSRERIVHEESLVVRAHHPEIIFYERDPLLGLKYWKAIKDINAPSGKDLVLQFEPFNLRNPDLDKLFYTWRVNNSKLANQNPQSRIFRLSSEAGSAGSQSINVSYENPKNIFMRGSAQVTVNID